MRVKTFLIVLFLSSLVLGISRANIGFKPDLFEAWESFSSQSGEGLEVSGFIDIANQASPQELLKLITTVEDPQELLTFAADALSSKLGQIEASELLEAYFLASPQKKPLVARALYGNSNPTTFGSYLALLGDPRVASEPNLEFFKAIASMALRSNDPKSMERIFDFLSAQPPQPEICVSFASDLRALTNKDLYFQVSNLQSPYSKSYNCVLVSLLKLLPLAESDLQVVSLYKKYFRSASLHTYDPERKLGLLYFLAYALENLAAKNSELASITQAHPSEVGKDMEWESQLAPFVKLWVEQSSLELTPEQKKEMAGMAIETAKSRYFLQNSQTITNNREVRFEEIQPFLYLEDKSPQSLGELETIVGFNIKSLGDFSDLRSSNDGPSVVWGKPINGP